MTGAAALVDGAARSGLAEIIRCPAAVRARVLWELLGVAGDDGRGNDEELGDHVGSLVCVAFVLLGCFDLWQLGML